jgi:Tfp pilus assembly protein PilX
METRNQQSGFALLMALIVVSVVVSIGLTVLDLTLKQLRLSTNSKDSETAFHAANAGLECARYWRMAESDAMEAGNNISPTCFGAPAMTPIVTNLSGINAHVYEMQTTWGVSTAQRCSQMTLLVISSDLLATTTVSGMQGIIPGYPYGPTKDCEPGARCTLISVRGYSRSCGEITARGTVQREVLLEL